MDSDNMCHDGAVLTARFNGNGDFFFTGGEDGVINFWKSCDGMRFAHFVRHGTDIRDVCNTK